MSGDKSKKIAPVEVSTHPSPLLPLIGVAVQYVVSFVEKRYPRQQTSTQKVEIRTLEHISNSNWSSSRDQRPPPPSIISINEDPPYHIMLPFLRKSEVVLSQFTLVLTVFIIYWKLVGKSYLLIWDDIFVGDLQAQYPKRHVDTATNGFWRYTYLIMYGFLGTLGQYSGYKLSTDTNNRGKMNDTTKRRVMLYGFFHTTIAIHHIVWGLVYPPGTYGSLTLPKQYHIIGGISGILTLSQSIQMLLARDFDFDVIIKRKTLCDMSTIFTLVEFVMFMISNLVAGVGWRNSVYETIAWQLSFTTIPVLFLVDAMYDKYQEKETKKKENTSKAE